MAKSRKAVVRDRRAYERSYIGRGFVLGAKQKAPSSSPKPRQKVSKA